MRTDVQIRNDLIKFAPIASFPCRYTIKGKASVTFSSRPSRGSIECGQTRTNERACLNVYQCASICTNDLIKFSRQTSLRRYTSRRSLRSQFMSVARVDLGFVPRVRLRSVFLRIRAALDATAQNIHSCGNNKCD